MSRLENARDGQAVLILGATSAIARALADQLARDGCRLILAGRDMPEIERIAADLRIRYGAAAVARAFDAVAFESHATFFDSCAADCPNGLDGVILCYGSLPVQKTAERDPALAQQTILTNFASPVSMLNLAANYFEDRNRGFICALSSVAGDRGRQSNYLYGSAKAGLTTYLQGLRNRLSKAGVPVLTVKPGFVDTAMTWGLPGMFLVATPQKVANDIIRAIRREANELYTPWFWRIIMGIIRHVPERIFKRMKM
jgi:short-subunit dehydrogenase